MANEQNLIPFGDRTESEQRAIQSAGGIASGKARRERKKMREQAEMLLSLPFQNREIQDQDGNVKSLLEEYKKVSGIDNIEDIDNQMAMLIAMFNVVLGGGKGSVQAFNSLRELVGEKQTDLNLNGGVNISFNGENDIED